MDNHLRKKLQISKLLDKQAFKSNFTLFNNCKLGFENSLSVSCFRKNYDVVWLLNKTSFLIFFETKAKNQLAFQMLYPFFFLSGMHSLKPLFNE